jgi:RNA polymerase sigma-70 factor (ECF subfamily)
LTDESTLLASARAGDLSAFQEIVEIHKKRVYRLALDLTGSHEDAEDLSQEVFVRAYAALGSFRGEARLSSWLYRITLNIYLDQHATQRDRYGVAAGKEEGRRAHEPPDTNPGPYETTAATILQNHVTHALAHLSPRERSVFVLRHYHDHSLKEIAQILEVRTGTVKSLLFRAVHKLRHELEFYKDRGHDR